MKNVKLGRQVLDYVVANPAEFNMDIFGVRMYPCQTVACLAGHTLLFSGWTLDEDAFFRSSDGKRRISFDIPRVARNLLGLTDEEFCGSGYAMSIFSGGQTNSEAIERFRVIVEKSEAEGTME